MFTLTINTDGDAFGTDDYEREAEIARILATIPAKLNEGSCSGVLRDVNGKAVGTWHDMTEVH